MANNQSEGGRKSNQPELADDDKLLKQQKKAFEQGTGNNSTTSDPSPVENDENNPQPQKSGEMPTKKITNQDTSITNQDDSVTGTKRMQNSLNDDEDVYKQSSREDYNSVAPEMDMPTKPIGKTEKKIPPVGK